MAQTAFHPKDKARSVIDWHLLVSGWMVQSKTEMNLGAGLGVAVREFQTTSGPVDYGLFVGRRLCGVIEAKPAGTTLSGFSEQAARYIADVPKHLVHDEGQVRFEYVASGTEMLFRDHVDPYPTSRRVLAFHRPETLERWLKEPHTLRRRLRAMPPVVTDGLRACQAEAAAALETSMASNHPRALVQMATGAGKTFTACTLSYRLLAHAGFKRILFLADRANLVRQTWDGYLAYRPPGTGRSFSEIYNVQKLAGAGVDKDAQIVVATIQRVFSVLTGRELDEDAEEASSFEQASAASISLSKISKLPVPLPPAAEAREIMERLEAALDHHGEVAAVLESEASDAARLKQAILKSEFEGRLVPREEMCDASGAPIMRPSASSSSHSVSPKQGRISKRSRTHAV